MNEMNLCNINQCSNCFCPKRSDFRCSWIFSRSNCANCILQLLPK